MRMSGPRRNAVYMQSYVASGCKQLASAPSLLLHARKLRHPIMEALFLGKQSVSLLKSPASKGMSSSAVQAATVTLFSYIPQS